MLSIMIHVYNPRCDSTPFGKVSREWEGMHTEAALSHPDYFCILFFKNLYLASHVEITKGKKCLPLGGSIDPQNMEVFNCGSGERV